MKDQKQKKMSIWIEKDYGIFLWIRKCCFQVDVNLHIKCMHVLNVSTLTWLHYSYVYADQPGHIRTNSNLKFTILVDKNKSNLYKLYLIFKFYDYICCSSWSAILFLFLFVFFLSFYYQDVKCFHIKKYKLKKRMKKNNQK